MLKGEHSAILSTFIKQPFVIKIFVWSFLSGCFKQVYCTLRAAFINMVLLLYLHDWNDDIIRGSYMNAYVLLNLLNKLRKRDKISTFLENF